MATGKFLIWRNSVGFDVDHKIHYGLGKGSADLVGIYKPTGAFIAFEIKTLKGRMSDEQKMWRDAVNAAGGHAFVVRSVDEAMQSLGLL